MAGIVTATASTMAARGPAGVSAGPRLEPCYAISASRSALGSVSLASSISSPNQGCSTTCSAVSSSASEVMGCKSGFDCVSSHSRGNNRCASTRTRAQTATWGGTQTQSRPGEEASLYELLGLSPSVSLKEVKTAYRQLARKFHPDVVPAQQKEECTRNFLKIHSAYTTLCDPERRAAYDLQLSLQRHQANGYCYRSSSPISVTWNTSSSYSAPSYYSTPNSFAYQWKGRSWETDQCW